MEYCTHNVLPHHAHIMCLQEDSMLDKSNVPDDLPESTGSNGGLPWYIVHLARVRLELLGKREGIKERLCQEVATITQQRARLIFLDRQRDILASVPASVVSFPVQADGSCFGLLTFQQKSARESLPHFSLAQIQEIADTCGWMLSTLMFSAFLQRVGRKEKLSLLDPLTKRELQVLQLMDCSDEEIGQVLKIEVRTVKKHREHIRAKIGADNDTQALTIAFNLHLYSPIEDVISRPVNAVD